MAGTTRDVVKEKITLKGKASHVTLKIADTAGLRETQDVIEKMGIERTLSAAKTADFIVFVVDSSKVNPGTLNAIGEQWASLGSPVARTFGVLTKVDLVSKVELGEAQRALEPLGLGRWMETSAQTGEGINSAALGVAELCEKNVQRELGEVVLTRHEQFLAVRSAVEHLERAYGSEHIDLFASDIRQALVSLNSLIGVTEVEEVLGRVFSQFCIGK
jgi:tRNA modification GTPase